MSTTRGPDRRQTDGFANEGARPLAVCGFAANGRDGNTFSRKRKRLLLKRRQKYVHAVISDENASCRYLSML